MSGIIYKFALFMASMTFLLCLVNDISVITSMGRAIFVFIGVLFTIYIAGHLMQIGFYITTIAPKQKEENNESAR